MINSKVVVLTKFYQGEINPFDGSALEIALQGGYKDITVVSMAPLSAKNVFEDLTRLGVKGVFITDSAYAGSDTIATSYVLSEALKRIKPDLIFCGRQSIDGDTAQIPPMLSERLNFDILTQIIEVKGDLAIDRNGNEHLINKNTIIAVERSKTLRFPSIFSKKSEITVWNNDFLGLDKALCGLKGSPTRVIKSYESDVGRRFCKFTTLENLDNLIKEGLMKERKTDNFSVGEKLDKVCYVGNLEKVASQISKEIIKLDVADITKDEFINELKNINSQAVLWEDDGYSKIYASQIAVKMGVGICADCTSFNVKDGKLIMTRPALGGNITADIICDQGMSFATVRTIRQDCKDVVFTIGKGAIDYIDKISTLAKKYDAELCSSRIVTDSGKMPYSAQVGLTGKKVCPKVYVAFGVSGAVQHTVAISGAGTIIAVNIDKQARIFDYSDYGIVDDIRELF